MTNFPSPRTCTHCPRKARWSVHDAVDNHTAYACALHLHMTCDGLAVNPLIVMPVDLLRRQREAEGV